MNDEKLRRFLAQRGMREVRRDSAKQSQDSAAYESFQASELYCPKCKRAVPTREKHLLYLPNGDLFDYSCPNCGTSLGSRRTG